MNTATMSGAWRSTARFEHYTTFEVKFSLLTIFLTPLYRDIRFLECWQLHLMTPLFVYTEALLSKFGESK